MIALTMIVDPSNLVVHFFVNVVEKVVVNRIKSIPEFELAPQEDAHFICEVEDEVR